MVLETHALVNHTQQEKRVVVVLGPSLVPNATPPRATVTYFLAGKPAIVYPNVDKDYPTNILVIGHPKQRESTNTIQKWIVLQSITMV